MFDLGRHAVTLPALLLLGALALAAAPDASAQQPAAANTASYTKAQADAGESLFQSTCARCHSDDLSGGDGPPLVGPPILYTWGGQFVSGLVRFVERNMPMNDPGTITSEQAVSLVAYILSMNKVPAGTTPLTATSTGVFNVPPGERH